MLSFRSKITRAVLAKLFLDRPRTFYVNELARRLSLDSGNLTRKLKELEAIGLLLGEIRGREKYYSLNPKFPLLDEYRQIVLKTFGIEAELRSALGEVPGIRRAFLFGSYAEDRMDGSSDLDLIVIGDHRVLDLQRKIATVQKKLSREITLLRLSPAEYKNKRRRSDFFKALEKRRRIDLL